jgi:hypothetical protein
MKWAAGRCSDAQIQNTGLKRNPLPVKRESSLWETAEIMTEVEKGKLFFGERR